MPEEQKVVVVVKPEGQEQEKTGKVEVKESEPASQPAAAVEKVVEKIVEATADAKAKEEVEPAAKVGEIKAQEPLAATAAPKVDVEAQKTTDNRQQEPAVAPVVAVKEEAAPIIQRDFAAAPQTAEAVVAPVVESTPPPPPPPAPPTETVVPTVTQPLTRTFTTPAGQPVTVFEHPDPTLVTTEPLPVVVVPEQKHVTYAEPVATTVEPLVVAVPAPEAQQVVAATPVVVSAPPPVVEAAPPGTAVIVPAAAVVEEQKPLVVEQTDGTIKETAAMAVLPTTPVVVAAPPPPPPTLVAEVPVVPVVVAPSPPPTAQPIPANVTAIQPPVRLEQPQIIPVPGSTQELPSVAQTLAAASSPTMAPAMNELPILALPVGIFAAHVAAAETRLVMEEKLPSFSGMDWSIRGENSDDVIFTIDGRILSSSARKKLRDHSGAVIFDLRHARCCLPYRRWYLEDRGRRHSTMKVSGGLGGLGSLGLGGLGKMSGLAGDSTSTTTTSSSSTTIGGNVMTTTTTTTTSSSAAGEEGKGSASKDKKEPKSRHRPLQVTFKNFQSGQPVTLTLLMNNSNKTNDGSGSTTNSTSSSASSTGTVAEKTAETTTTTNDDETSSPLASLHLTPSPLADPIVVANAPVVARIERETRSPSTEDARATSRKKPAYVLVVAEGFDLALACAVWMAGMGEGAM